jgi:multidrug efflux pump
MMCSRFCKHKPEAEQSRFYHGRRRSSTRHRGVRRTLQVVLRYQTITLLVTIGTLVADHLLFIVVPQGLLSRCRIRA